MLVFVVLLAVALFFAALPWAAGAQGQGQDRPGIVTIVGGDPAVGTGLSASLSDLDTVSGTPTWQWSRSGTRRGIYADIDSSTSASYTPVEADKAFFLRVTVSYNDGHGTNKTASFTTLLPVGVGTNSLVKNTGQGDRNGRVVRHPYARFVTGDNPGGYALTSVGIKSWSWVGPYDAAVKEVLDGNRVGRDVAWLRPRVPPVGGRLNWFDAAPGVTLEPNTTYWLYHCCLQQPELTSSYDEDSGAAHGWSIDNLYGGDNLGHPIVRHDLVPVIAIEGYALLGPPGPPLGLSATAGTDSLTLSWSQPGSLGHRPVTKYQVRSKHTADDEYGEWTDVGTGASLTAAVTGLGGGNHVVQVRAVNDQGAGAEARLVAATLRPGVSSVRVSSTPGYASAGHRDTFGSDDTIVISVAFTAAVTVTGSPTFTFVLGDADAAATYSGGTGTDRLTFSYDVAATDSDSDGISWAANQIALGADDSIVAAGDASLAATIIHAAQSALARTRVDGGVTPNQPAQFAAETATLSVRENAAPGVVGTVSASDPEGDGMIYWTNIIHERSEESDAFYRDFYADDGEISLKRSANLDYESGTRYAIYIDTSDCRDRRGTREYNPAGPVAPPGAPYCRRDDRLAVTIEVVPASDPAPPQTQNVDPPQTQNVDPPQTQNVDPPQTQNVDPPQTQNVDPPQTQNVDPPQTQNVDPPQTQNVDPPQTQTQTQNVDPPQTQTRLRTSTRPRPRTRPRPSRRPRLRISTRRRWAGRVSMWRAPSRPRHSSGGSAMSPRAPTTPMLWTGWPPTA